MMSNYETGKFKPGDYVLLKDKHYLAQIESTLRIIKLYRVFKLLSCDAFSNIKDPNKPKLQYVKVQGISHNDNADVSDDIYWIPITLIKCKAPKSAVIMEKL